MDLTLRTAQRRLHSCHASRSVFQCEQLAPSFDSADAGDDLQVTALSEGSGGVRLAYSFTGSVGLPVRELTLDLLCDPDATGTAPDDAVCEDFQCLEVSVQWSTAAACSDDPEPEDPEPEPEPDDLPPAPPPPGGDDGDEEDGVDVYIIVIGAVAGLCVIQGMWLVLRDRCAGGSDQQRTRRQSMNIDPKGGTGSSAIMPWAKREKKDKTSSHKENKSKRRDYEKIENENGDDLTDWIRKSNAKAAAKDQIGMLAPRPSSGRSKHHG